MINRSHICILKTLDEFSSNLSHHVTNLSCFIYCSSTIMHLRLSVLKYSTVCCRVTVHWEIIRQIQPSTRVSPTVRPLHGDTRTLPSRLLVSMMAQSMRLVVLYIWVPIRQRSLRTSLLRNTWKLWRLPCAQWWMRGVFSITGVTKNRWVPSYIWLMFRIRSCPLLEDQHLYKLIEAS